MKKNFFNSIIILSCFLFFSCEQNISVDRSKEFASLFCQQGTSSSSSRSYKVITTSDNNQIVFSGTGSRTILPESLSVSDLDFYLYGKNSITSKELTFETDSGSTKCLKVNVTPYNAEGTEGCFSINLDSARYALTLAAVEKGQSFDKNNLSANTLLIGDATVDPQVSKIRFCLSGKRFMNASGMYSKAQIGLYTLGWTYSDYSDSAADFACKVGIYKKDIRNTVVKEINEFSLPHYDDASQVPSSIDGFPNSFIYTVNTPGEYNFTVCFYDKNSKRAYYYSDTIFLLGNQTTEKIIEIPNIISKKPDAPSAMTCGYIDPVDETSGKYSLNVEWTDNAVNESYFRLELMDFTGDDNVLTTEREYVKCILGKSSEYGAGSRDTLWEHLALTHEVTVVENEYFELMGLVASGAVKGSLSRNSNSVLFAVTLGARYLMRMCAVNDEGVSEYEYPDIFSSMYRNLNATPWIWDSSDSGNCNLSINRYKIEYHLNGGDFYDDSSREDVTSSVSMKKNVYSSQSENGTALVSPLAVPYVHVMDSSSGTASLKVYKESSFYPWKGWNKSSSDGSTVADSASISGYRYTGCGNMELYSKFDVMTDSKNELSVYNTSNSNYGVPGSNICLMPSSTGSLVLVPKEVSADDSVSLSLAGCKSLYVLVMDDFYWTKVEFGKQGSQFLPVGSCYSTDDVSKRPVTQNSWTTLGTDGTTVIQKNCTHLYWGIPLGSCEKGTYYLNVTAKKYSVSDTCYYTIKVILND